MYKKKQGYDNAWTKEAEPATQLSSSSSFASYRCHQLPKFQAMSGILGGQQVRPWESFALGVLNIRWMPGGEAIRNNKLPPHTTKEKQVLMEAVMYLVLTSPCSLILIHKETWQGHLKMHDNDFHLSPAVIFTRWRETKIKKYDIMQKNPNIIILVLVLFSSHIRIL